MPTPSEDFYLSTNDWWLNDPTVTIPDEYASWGSFIQLHDKSLKTQVVTQTIAHLYHLRTTAEYQFEPYSANT